MAETLDDLFDLNLLLSAKISLDWARIKEDRIYQQFAMLNEESALQNYLGYYLERENLLSMMPVTNGPGKIFSFQIL